jgi:hypothetical protein
LEDYCERIEVVYLEHDLEVENMHPGNENSGMEVVRAIERMDSDKFRKLAEAHFVVHTWNDYAGPKMVDRLNKLNLKVDHIPFGS